MEVDSDILLDGVVEEAMIVLEVVVVVADGEDAVEVESAEVLCNIVIEVDADVMLQDVVEETMLGVLEVTLAENVDVDEFVEESPLRNALDAVLVMVVDEVRVVLLERDLLVAVDADTNDVLDWDAEVKVVVIVAVNEVVDVDVVVQADDVELEVDDADNSVVILEWVEVVDKPDAKVAGLVLDVVWEVVDREVDDVESVDVEIALLAEDRVVLDFDVDVEDAEVVEV
mmetsp:Transcript_53542/g.125331  ORF Transcript_53542/g.125331 Transcript_53542/m.125331 type:complete len:228 (-) Transcript_53542:337-1020(-)